MPTSSQSPGRLRRRLRELHRRLVLRSFARETIQSIESGDDYNDQLEVRVIRVEEVIAARWPRSAVLRRQLAREIRASVAPYPHDYIPRGDFFGRRLQATSETATLVHMRRVARVEERLRRAGK